jgi:hypothetical protein
MTAFVLRFSSTHSEPGRKRRCKHCFHRATIARHVRGGLPVSHATHCSLGPHFPR